ncbi:hypothetical protein GQ457_01G032420 [Hibiscus cannabinus]
MLYPEKLRDNSDSESFSDPPEKMVPSVVPNDEGSERRSEEKDGSFIEPCFGNDYGEMPGIDNETGSRLGDMDLMGNGSKETPQTDIVHQDFMNVGFDIPEEDREMEKELTKQYMKKCWAGVEDMGQGVSKINLKENGMSSDILTSRAIDDLDYMGFGQKPNEESGIGKSAGLQSNCDIVSEEESDKSFFPELVIEKKNKKKYDSLLDLQDKALSTADRRKRDRALKKSKSSRNNLDYSELSGRSLSDSDLAARWVSATKEAKKTLNLGKKLGVQVVGDEQDVVNELISMENK